MDTRDEPPQANLDKIGKRMLGMTRGLLETQKEKLARARRVNQANLKDTIGECDEEEKEESQKRPRKDIISASNSPWQWKVE